MEQRTDDGLSPYRIFPRAEWAARREDTPMTLTPAEVGELRSLNDRLDMKEVEEIYLPLSRLLSLYVATTQRLFRAQQSFLGTEDTKLPYIIGVAGSVAVGKSTTARVLKALLARWPNVLQTGRLPKDGKAIPYVSDFFDFSIYLDANEEVLLQWYVDRFLTLRETAFRNPKSYFHRYSKLSDEEAIDTATSIWARINLV